LIDFLCYPTSDILLPTFAKKLIEKKCQTCDIHFEALKEINTILKNALEVKKKRDETTIIKLRKQVSSLTSKLEKFENNIALNEAIIEAKSKKL